jgi:hypothetical protein
MTALSSLAVDHAPAANGALHRGEILSSGIRPALDAHEAAAPPPVAAPADRNHTAALAAARYTLPTYTPACDLDTVRQALRAEINALDACVKHRQPAVSKEIAAYLDGARTLLDGADGSPVPLGSGCVDAARALFTKAATLYQGYVHKSNRLYYVGGVLGSAFALGAVMPPLLYLVAHGFAPLVESPAHPQAGDVFRAVDLPALFVLFGFAALGSVVSVLSRLDKQTVPPVFTRALVIVAGMGRPFVAAVFATVVYALVRGQIVNLAPGTPQAPGGVAIHAGSVVHWWCVVVAFLCGYSERFASDLLGQSPLGKGTAGGPAPVEFAAAGTAGAEVVATRQG